MIIDATFWVAISFFIFILLIFYFKVPSKVIHLLDENINSIKKLVDDSEKLKEEAKNRLAEKERKLDGAKSEIKKMINDANDDAEKQVIKMNEILHHQMDIRKKNTEEKSRQMKIQAIRDVKNASLNIAFESIEKLMLNSLDKSKLDKIYNQSVDETKLALQKKSS